MNQALPDAAQEASVPAWVPGQAVAGSAAQDCSAAIAALRASGAQQWEPLRLHYLESLHARAQAQPERVKCLLEARLAQGLAELQQCLAVAQAAAGPVAAAAVEASNQAPVTDEAAAAPAQSLASLLHTLAQQGAIPDGAEAALNAAGPRSELKALSQFRSTWSRLSADKQVAQALDQAPQNAGPINSHMLVLRSLALMREIAPDYLNRFISYADTLLCLEACEQSRLAPARPGADGTTARKPRSRKA